MASASPKNTPTASRKSTATTLMKVSGWASVTFASLLVLGNGAYFSWQQSQLQRRTSQIDEVVKLNQLEKDVGDIFHSIVDLTENYIRARDEYAKAPNPELLRKYTELNA